MTSKIFERKINLQQKMLKICKMEAHTTIQITKEERELAIK